MCADSRQMGIVAIFTGHNLREADKIQSGDLYDFFKRYPTPFAFEKASKAYLDYVGEKCKECKEVWEKSMVQFHESIYGKRYEYYKQMNLMKKEANRRATAGEKIFRPKVNEILESESDAILKASFSIDTREVTSSPTKIASTAVDIDIFQFLPLSPFGYLTIGSLRHYLPYLLHSKAVIVTEIEQNTPPFLFVR